MNNMYPPYAPFPFGEEKKPFRKRHPIAFIIILLVIIGGFVYAARGCLNMLSSTVPSASFGNRVGVVNIDGIILDSKDIIEWTDKLANDSSVVGVIVRIDSPGGAVTPSQEIYYALQRLAAKKPLIASMGTLAASGGYMVALPAEIIVAAPSTITGSIGTRMDLSNFMELMGKIGVKQEILHSGAMKDAGSPYKELTREERDYFMGMLSDMHAQFKEAVAEARKLSPEELEKVSDGRAFTGRQARELKLVDILGDKDKALDLMFQKINRGTALPVIEGPLDKNSAFARLFNSMFEALHNEAIKASYTRPTVLY